MSALGRDAICSFIDKRERDIYVYMAACMCACTRMYVYIYCAYGPWWCYYSHLQGRGGEHTFFRATFTTGRNLADLILPVRARIRTILPCFDPKVFPRKYNTPVYRRCTIFPLPVGELLVAIDFGIATRRRSKTRRMIIATSNVPKVSISERFLFRWYDV